MSEWAIHSKKWAIPSIAHFWWATWANPSWLLIFGERPEKFAHIAHFWRATWANRSFFKINMLKNKIFLANILGVSRSFIMNDLSELLTVAHFSWATWAIRSWSLICLQPPERFAHSCSFVLSDLSESLTDAHLIWAKWANEGMSRKVAIPCHFNWSGSDFSF